MFGHAQDYILRYEKSQIIDKQSSVTLEYELKISNQHSTFSVVNLDLERSKGMNNYGRLFYTDMGYKPVYFDINQNLLHFSFNLAGEDLLIKSEPFIKWKLLNDSKIINGYTCYKAIGESNAFDGLGGSGIVETYEVWYTPQSSINIGPALYQGLQGLIVEAKDLNQNVTYKLLSLNRLEVNSLNILELPKVKSMKLDDFVNTLKRMTRKNN
jgi:GLPGLI family protein